MLSLRAFRLSRRAANRVAAVVLATTLAGGAAAAAAGFYWEEWPRVEAESAPPPVPASNASAYQAPDRFEAIYPGIRTPPTVPPAEARLEDGERVIGVSAGGRHRAYVVQALSGGAKVHIIDDILAGMPLCVTFCDLRQCARVFAGKAGDAPPDVAQGGLYKGRMVLTTAGHEYLQDRGEALGAAAAPFPYGAHPYEMTTWGEWWRAHPDTDVYVEPPPDVATGG